MNINLISPSDSLVQNVDEKTNGHSYSIRFKQDILIPAMSKIFMNFCSLTRQSEISFSEDQTLFINFPADQSYVDSNGPQTISNVFPSLRCVPTFDNNFDTITLQNGQQQNINKYSVNIPKGFYNFEKFYKTITAGINDALEYKDPVAKTSTDTRNDIYRASEIYDSNPVYVDDLQKLTGASLSGDATLSIGVLQNISYVKDRTTQIDNTFLSTFVASTAHATTPNNGVVYNGEACAYVKTSATVMDTSTAGQSAKVYDSYAMAQTHYRHTDMDDATPAGKSNIMEFTTLRTLKEMSDDRAGIAFGLDSLEVANGFNEGGDGDAYPLNEPYRTRGTANQYGAGGKFFYNPKQSFYNIAEADGNSVVDNGVGGSKKVPTALITITISAEGDAAGLGAGNLAVEVYARSNKGGSANAGSINQNGLGGMRSIHDHSTPKGTIANKNKFFTSKLMRYRLDNKGLDENSPVSIGFQTYFDPNDPAFGTSQQRLNYRVLNLHTLDMSKPIREQKSSIIYDSSNSRSADNNNYFKPTTFGKCENNSRVNYKSGTQAQAYNKIRSMGAPFTPIVFSNCVGHGFQDIVYRGVPKGVVGGVDYDARPLTMYNKYYLTASEEMAETFRISTEVNSKLVLPTDTFQFSPNTSVPQQNTTFTDLSRGWRSKSYSIFLKGLPLNNYKNTTSHRSGGFGKQILANVPIPFKDSLEHFDIKTTGVYSPNTPIVSELYNQDLVVNKLEVNIKDMATDKDATEIENSVINLTIQPPAGYTGNVNAIKGFANLPPSIRPS